MLTMQDIAAGLKDIGVTPGMEVEVHASLSSFGPVAGGAKTVIDALQQCCTPQGSIFMPALRLSPPLPITEQDRRLGIVTKIKILPPDAEKTGMGAVADAFRKRPDVCVGEGVFRIAGWGKNACRALDAGLGHLIQNGGKALLLGVDIYKLTAMHYVEENLPREITDIFAPDEAVDRLYPPTEWFIETGAPPVQAWYTIQRMAYEKGLIKDGRIGDCRTMFFDVWDVVSLYAQALKEDPLGLYGLR